MITLPAKTTLTRLEFSALVGISEDTTDRLIRRRNLETVRIGRAVRIVTESAQRFLNRRTQIAR